ncbi:MAG: DUF503 domain-containing protein [Actinomycetota bacterium]|nr:DUF503 domain-containing protein [Actinomycetota bacterium]
MLVVLSSIDLRIPGVGSLKEKRRVVKALTQGLRGRFNVAVAEVDHQDQWQRATLGVSAVSAEGFVLRKVMHEVERFVARQPLVEIIEHRMTLHGQDD